MNRISKYFHSLLKRDRRKKDTPDFPLRSIIISPSTKIDLYRDIAKEFIERVLEMSPEDVWISDWSQLSDFRILFESEVGDVEKYLLDKIKRIYGVDVSDIEDGNLVRIFERLS
ncbi:MAG: hypothetical protein ACFFF4_14155 [Candidatus Thorarchaeota archaeon]